MITAHSGSDGLGDNSLIFIQTMIEQGVDAFEVDCQVDSQGKFYLAHDEVDDSDGLVTLDEVFALMAFHSESTTLINVDCKQGGIGTRVLELGRKYKILDRVVLSGSIAIEEYQTDERKHLFYNLENKIDVSKWPLSNENFKQVLSEIAESGIEVIQSYYQLITPELFNIVQASNLKLSVWTVDDLSLIDHFIKIGIYNVTTNHALAYLKNRAPLRASH